MKDFSLLINMYRGHLQVTHEPWHSSKKDVTYVRGSHGSGKTEYCLTLAKTYLNNCKSVLYISPDPPGKFRVDELFSILRTYPPDKAPKFLMMKLWANLDMVFESNDSELSIDNFDLIIIDDIHGMHYASSSNLGEYLRYTTPEQAVVVTKNMQPYPYPGFTTKKLAGFTRLKSIMEVLF